MELSAEPLPRATPESVGMSSDRLERIGRMFKAEIDSGRTPGAVLAIARKGKLVYYEAFGFLNKTAGTPMRKDAIFPIASMTKPMVAVGALSLAEEGRLLIHDPIGVYLPALKAMKVADRSGVVDAVRQPTVQDLMRHTAGFTYGNQGTSELHKRYPSGSTDDMTGPELVQKLAGLPLHYQPGTKWDYSFGLDVLGLAIESITGKRLGDVLGERIFRPLGMIDTSFAVPAAKANRIAQPLAADPLTGQPQPFHDPTKPYKFDCGGGCSSSTALDYLRFAEMLRNGGTLDGTRVLSRKTVEYMTADQLGPEVDVSRLWNFPVDHIDGFGFGLGVAVRRTTGIAGMPGTPGAFHWSGSQGTLFWVDPKEELAVVYLAQTPGQMRVRYRQLIPMLVLQAITN